MTAFTLSSTVRRPYDRTLADVREALAGQGFGILTEIDLKATLKTKLDVDVQPETILGACRPALAYQALQAEPSIAAVLPCNVVVRSVDAETTVVEAFDPYAMIGLAGTTTLDDVAAEARTRLTAALAVVEQEN
jgi:uncharacterized protein (DUF302 family)